MSTNGADRIERFERKNLKVIRDRLNALMDEHGFAGIEVRIGDISYTEGDAQFMVFAQVKGGKTRDYRLLERAAEALNLDLERVVDGMHLVGYVRRRRAYPFIVEDAEGNRFKMMTSAAIRNFSRESGKVEEVIKEETIQQHSEALDGNLPSLV